MWRKRVDILCMIGVLTMLLAACGSKRDEAQPPIAREITVYTNILLDQVKTYLADFNKTYPDIKVHVVRDSLGNLNQRLLAEQANPQADVIWGLAVTSLVLMEWRDMLSPYAPAGLNRVTPQFRDTSHPPYWVGMDAWMAVLCVNTVELEKLGLPMPLTWRDLTNPAYRGHIMTYNPTVTGTGYMTITAILQIYGEIAGWEYLDALHENISAYVPSDVEPCQLAGAGKVFISMSYDLEGIQQKINGAPIEVIFPTEKTGWDMEASALVKKLHVKPEAKIFLDWALSDSAMRHYAQNYAITAARTDVPLPQGFPNEPKQYLLDRNFPWDTANRNRILQEWLKRYSAKVAKDS